MSSTQARPRHPADHGHRSSARGCLHVDQPARLLGRIMQRRAAAGGRLVARAGAHARQVLDGLDQPAARHSVRSVSPHIRFGSWRATGIVDSGVNFGRQHPGICSGPSSSPAQVRGQTSPNPMVGAVIVKDGRVIGEGATQPPGRGARRAHGARRLRGGPGRRHAVRLARALLPQGPHAALHRRDHRGRHRARGDRLRGPVRRRRPGAGPASSATRASTSSRC